MSDTILFEEEQRFNQKFLWGFLVIINLALFVSCIVILFFNNENNLNVLFGFLPAIVILVAVTYLIAKSKLVTQIRENGIYVKFYPFHLSFKKYSWEDINELYLRKYKPLTEYGGWGLKLGPSGSAYNVSGNVGIQLVLKNNSKVLIGTNTPDNVIDVLTTLGKLDQPSVRS